jgi:hypothetical protein
MPTNSPRCESVEKPRVSPSDHQLSNESSAWAARRSREQAGRIARARCVNGERRFVDPTLCDTDYKKAELEFMQAMQQYKRESGRLFPTWSEVLEVLTSLGYQKVGTTG